MLVMESLPRGPSGKVVLNELRDIAETRLAGPAVKTSGTMEDQVIAVSASVLGVPRESIRAETSTDGIP